MSSRLASFTFGRDLNSKKKRKGGRDVVPGERRGVYAQCGVAKRCLVRFRQILRARARGSLDEGYYRPYDKRGKKGTAHRVHALDHHYCDLRSEGSVPRERKEGNPGGTKKKR